MNFRNLIISVMFAVAIGFSGAAFAHDHHNSQAPSATSSVQAAAQSLSTAANNLSDAANKLTGQTGKVADSTASAVSNTSAAVANAATKVGDAAASTADSVKPILADALRGLVDALKSGADWAKVQIPDVVRELIEWNIAKDIALIAIFPVFFLIFLWMCKHYMKKSTTIGKSNECECDWAQVFGVVSGILAIVFLVGTVISIFVNGFDLLQIIFAPKVWLLEYAADLFKAVKGG